VLSVGCLDIRLGEVRVQLDLVDRRHDLGPGYEVGQVAAHEVADADNSDVPIGQQFLECFVRFDGSIEPIRRWLVQDQQVQLIDPELSAGLLEGVQRLAVAVVADPNLVSMKTSARSTPSDGYLRRPVARSG